MIAHVMMMIGDIFKQEDNKAPAKQNGGLALVYVVFVSVALLVFHWMAEGEFSAVFTLSAVFQSLAFSLLGVHALSTGGVQGISAKSLQLDAIALVCRLSSTTWLEGYLPADPSGEFMYQVFDFLSLGMVLWLLHRVLNAQHKTQEDDDALPVTPFVLGSLLLGGLFHGDLNDRPFFDTIWMCGLFVGSVSIVPQLWLMTRNNTKAPAMTSHFVAVTAFSRILSGLYMWHAAPEITCEPWVKDFEHAGYAILAAHAVNLMLLGDFAFYYVKNVATRGLNSPLELAEKTFTV